MASPASGGRTPPSGLALWAVAGAIGGYFLWQNHQAANAKPVYVSQEVKRGNLSITVAANGTLQPTRTVNVGL